MDAKRVAEMVSEAAAGDRFDDLLALQARNGIVAALASGEAQDVRGMERAFVDSICSVSPGVVTWPAGSTLDGAREAPDVKTVETRLGAQAAHREALVGLIISGTVVFVEAINHHASYKVSSSGSSTSGTMDFSVADVATSQPTGRVRLRRPPSSGTATSTILDPDLYLAGLRSLGPSPEAERCVREAFGALQAGLYLASVSLTALLAEVLLFDEASRLSASASLATITADTPSFTVQRLLFDEIRTGKGLKNQANATQAHAELLRQIRNYGLHPRSHAPDPRNGYLGEVPAALLLMGTHSYLVTLHDLVDKRLQSPP